MQRLISYRISFSILCGLTCFNFNIQSLQLMHWYNNNIIQRGDGGHWIILWDSQSGPTLSYIRAWCRLSRAALCRESRRAMMWGWGRVCRSHFSDNRRTVANRRNGSAEIERCRSTDVHQSPAQQYICTALARKPRGTHRMRSVDPRDGSRRDTHPGITILYGVYTHTHTHTRARGDFTVVFRAQNVYPETAAV